MDFFDPRNSTGANIRFGDWVGLIIDTLRDSGVFDTAVVSETAPTNLTVPWLDTSADISVFRTYDTNLSQWTPATFNSLFGGDGIAAVVDDTSPQLGGVLDTNGNAITESRGTALIAASTLPANDDGNIFEVVNTATITRIDAAPSGRRMTLRFASAGTVLENSGRLLLPGGADITTQAGDRAEFYQFNPGVADFWRCTWYTRADGTALSGIGSVVDDTSPQLGGFLDSNGNSIWTSHGAAVTAASTLTLGNDGNKFNINGNTAITAIGGKITGAEVTLHFTGTPVLTHSVNLELPTGANITVVAGDVATFYQYNTNQWRCKAYTRADGTPLAGGGGGGGTAAIEAIGAPVNVAGSTNVDFTGFSSTYTDYFFVTRNVLSNLASAEFICEASSDGGTTFVSSSNSYRNSSPSSRTTSVVMSGSVGNSNSGSNITLRIFDPLSTSRTGFYVSGGTQNASGSMVGRVNSAVRDAAVAINAVRFRCSGTTFLSGEIQMYGIRNGS